MRHSPQKKYAHNFVPSPGVVLANIKKLGEYISFKVVCQYLCIYNTRRCACVSVKTQTYHLHHIRAHILYRYLYVHRRRRITRMQGGGLPAEEEGWQRSSRRAVPGADKCNHIRISSFTSSFTSSGHVT